MKLGECVLIPVATLEYMALNTFPVDHFYEHNPPNNFCDNREKYGVSMDFILTMEGKQIGRMKIKKNKHLLVQLLQ